MSDLKTRVVIHTTNITNRTCYFCCRYLAICHTIEKKISRKACKIIILCMWIAAISLFVPWAIVFKHDYLITPLQKVPMCFEHWPDAKSSRAYFIDAILLCCYTIPLILIIVCYLLIEIQVWRRNAHGERISSSEVVHKSKVKVMKMLAVVATTFAISRLPLYVVRLVYIIACEEFMNQTIITDILQPICDWLGASNSRMNPIIYCFLSNKFRSGFREIITCCARRQFASRNGTCTTYLSVDYTNGNFRGVSMANTMC
jgi:hypothetical protein